MITFKYQKSTRLTAFGICGIILAISGIFIYKFEPLRPIIKMMTFLSPHSIMYLFWQDPPFEIYIKVYVFNFTNSKEFLEGKEKMRLEEFGPYVYQEFLRNTNSTFNPNGTLTFHPKRELVFRREKSIGDPKVDKFLSPNIPLLGISSFLRDASFFTNLALSQLTNILDSQPVLNLTVDEYLWGYDDPLVELANKVLPNWINFRRFGIMDRLMALDNDTNTVTIKTTEEYLNESNALTEDEKTWPYVITRFNGSPGLPLWGYKNTNKTYVNNTRCNTLEGSFVEGVFPQNLKENSTMRLYRRAFCRPVELKYEGKGDFKGFNIHQYRINENFLYTPEENPDNACYCHKGKCLKKGLGSIAPCYYGMPIVLSQPHFYNSDKSLLNNVEGLKPNRENHDTVLKIYPELGIPLGANLRIQINLDVDTKYSRRSKPFNGITIPLFWLEMSLEEVPTIASFLITLMYSVLPIVQVVCMWGFMIFGIAMVAVSALFFFYGPTDYGLEDPYDNRIGYTPIRIIPVTQYLNPPSIKITK